MSCQWLKHMHNSQQHVSRQKMWSEIQMMMTNLIMVAMTTILIRQDLQTTYKRILDQYLLRQIMNSPTMLQIRILIEVVSKMNLNISHNKTDSKQSIISNKYIDRSTHTESSIKNSFTSQSIKVTVGVGQNKNISQVSPFSTTQKLASHNPNKNKKRGGVRHKGKK